MAPTARARDLAEEIAVAHGGADRWRRLAAVDVRFSARGLAFLSKGQPAALSTVAGRFGTTAQSVRLQGKMPRPWNYEAENGAALLADLQRLINGRRLRWTAADAATFAATAMWNYLNLPFLLLNPAFGLEVLPSDGREVRRLRVRFPPDIATHSRHQTLHIATNGLIVRHDYTALAIGPWAAGSQLLAGYKDFDGIRFATQRRVSPRVRGHRFPGPTLVRINVRDLRLVAN
jgi:hypothetical protein